MITTTLRILCLGLLLTTGTARALAAQERPAGEPARRESVERLLVMTKVEVFHQKTLDEAMARYASVPMIETIGAQVWELMAKYNSWAAIKEDMIAVYAELFTEEEVQGLIAFHETPLGARLIEVTPVLTSRLTDLSMARLRAGFIEMGLPVPPTLRPGGPPG